MITKTTTIHGYTVELDIDGDQTQCTVTHKRFHGSLAMLSFEGYLINCRDEEHIVPAWIIAEIETWAENNGY